MIQNGMANVERAMELDGNNREYQEIYRQMAGADPEIRGDGPDPVAQGKRVFEKVAGGRGTVYGRLFL